MIIRKCKIDDAKSMLKMLLALDNETKYMMYMPGERPKSIENIESMINETINGNNLLLAAVDQDEIAGFLSAERGAFNKIKHSAYIVIGIREQYRHQGIGSRFFDSLDNWAKENHVTRLELTVMCPNKAAKHLYEKNGFQVEGIKRNSIFMDGNYVNEYYMAKLYD